MKTILGRRGCANARWTPAASAAPPRPARRSHARRVRRLVVDMRRSIAADSQLRIWNLEFVLSPKNESPAVFRGARRIPNSNFQIPNSQLPPAFRGVVVRREAPLAGLVALFLLPPPASASS